MLVLIVTSFSAANLDADHRQDVPHPKFAILIAINVSNVSPIRTVPQDISVSETPAKDAQLIPNVDLETTASSLPPSAKLDAVQVPPAHHRTLFVLVTIVFNVSPAPIVPPTLLPSSVTEINAPDAFLIPSVELENTAIPQESASLDVALMLDVTPDIDASLMPVSNARSTATAMTLSSNSALVEDVQDVTTMPDADLATFVLLESANLAATSTPNVPPAHLCASIMSAKFANMTKTVPPENSAKMITPAEVANTTHNVEVPATVTKEPAKSDVAATPDAQVVPATLPITHVWIA